MAFNRLFSFLCVICVLIALNFGCRETHLVRPSSDELSIMSYNLGEHYLALGDVDPQTHLAILKALKRLNPGVLLIQGMGSQQAFNAFKNKVNYPHSECLPSPTGNLNLAIFCRYPVFKIISHTNLFYSIKSVQLQVQHGIQEIHIDTGNATPLIVFNVDFKSKDYLPTNQNEMRRNEARILRQFIGRRFKNNPKARILLGGTLNDSLDSATLRRVLGSGESSMKHLLLNDRYKHYWTWHDKKSEAYFRTDYLLCSPSLFTEIVWEKSHIPLKPKLQSALTHRPLYAVLKIDTF